MHNGTGRSCCGNSGTDFDRLDSLQGHDRCGKYRVEPFVPLRIASEAGGNLVDHNFEDPSDRVSCPQRLINFAFHPLLSIRIRTPEQNLRLGGEIEI